MVAVLGASAGPIPGVGNVAATNEGDGPARYIVAYDPGVAAPAAGGEFLGAPVLAVHHSLALAVVLARPSHVTENVTGDSAVRYVERDLELRWIDPRPADPAATPVDGPAVVRARGAWEATRGEAWVQLCVVDTGVRATHEDLAAATAVGGYDLRNGDGDPDDDHGHGTYVAGIAAATIDNGLGYDGVAQPSLRAVKVLDASGRGWASDVAAGIATCADLGRWQLTVILLALGSSEPSRALEESVAYASGTGALVVAAAGNRGPCLACVDVPASYDEAVAVTCVTRTLARCAFSARGADADLAAPGENVAGPDAAADDAYAVRSGTGASAAHVAAVATLVWSRYPGFTNAQLAAHLRGTAQDLGVAQPDGDFGHGLVDARAALQALAKLRTSPGGNRDTVVLRETFDDGIAQGFALTGLWHVNEPCARTVATLEPLPRDLVYNVRSPGPCTVPTAAWYATPPGCSLDPTPVVSACERTAGSATFPLDLTGLSDAHLQLSDGQTVEPSGRTYVDVRRVEARPAGQPSWLLLRQWDSNTPFTFDARVDLAAVVGLPVTMRLTFDSRDGIDNDQAGWVVRELTVYADTNHTPVAVAPPLEVPTGTPFMLDGSASWDADGPSGLAHQWSDEEGAIVGAEATLPFDGYGTPGTRWFSLRVTDEHGNADTAAVPVHVS